MRQGVRHGPSWVAELDQRQRLAAEAWRAPAGLPVSDPPGGDLLPVKAPVKAGP